MVTERVRTLPTEPTEGEIVKSNPLLSFINIDQRGTNSNPCSHGSITTVSMHHDTCMLLQNATLGLYYGICLYPNILVML